MEQLVKYVQQYFVAIADDDTARAEGLLATISIIVDSQLRLYGAEQLQALLDLIEGDVPEGLEYVPDPNYVAKTATDFREVLIGLASRMNEERAKLVQQYPEKSSPEIIKLLISTQTYQATRIIESQAHVFEERARLDIVGQMFSGSEYRLVKKWVAKVDANTCAICLAMNGTTVGFEENFVYDDSEVDLDSHYSDMADAHPHCRCRIEFEVERRQ